MNGKSKNAECLLFILIGGLLALLYRWAALSPYNEEGVFHGHNYNLIVYAGSLLLAFVLFLLGMLVITHLRRLPAFSAPEKPGETRGKVQRTVLYGIFIAALAASVVLIYAIYTHENSLYPKNTAASYLRQLAPHPLYFGLIVFLSVILFISWRQDSGYRPNMLLRYGLIPVFAFINACLVWCPNILKDTGAGTLHIHAVTNTIINVMHGAPYDQYNVSIYGHYALLAAPLAKLLGNDLTAVMLSLSVFAWIAFAAAFYAAHALIRSNRVYVLTLFAITGTTTILTRRGQYFQVNPLRLLFPALTLALTAYTISHMQRNRQVLVLLLEFLTGAAALIWNLETGLFCILTILVMRVFRSLYTAPLFSRQTLRNLLLGLLVALLSVGAAYAAVGFWNVLHHAPFGSIRQYTYPYFSGIYNVNHLRERLPSVPYLYFFEILLFGFTALSVLLRQASCGEEEQTVDTVAFAASVSGLLSLVYFMNRAVYGNMSISHIQCSLLLGYHGARAIRIRKGAFLEQLRSPGSFLITGLSTILFALCFWFAVEGALCFPVACDFRVKSSWNTKSLDEAAEALKATIPEGTFAFGTYVPELYAQLGWDTGCHMIDWSDINAVNREYALEQAHSRRAFVSTQNDLDHPGYRVTAEVPAGEYTFRYYERISSQTA